MPYRNLFVKDAKALRNKATQLRQLHQIYKLMGSAVAGMGGLAMIVSGGALMPLSFGVALYLGALFSESQRTGKVLPFPFLGDDLNTLAGKTLADAQAAPTLGTQTHHYLDPEDKAAYYLTNFQGHRLTALAQEVTGEEFDHLFTNLVDHLVTAHAAALNHPELIGQALGTNFLDDAIAALPKDMDVPAPALPRPQAQLPAPSIGADTRLNAVDVPAAEATPTPPTPMPMAMKEVEEPPPAVIPDAPPPLPVFEPPAPKGEIAETAMDVILGSPYQSRALFGSQRTGKSYLAALASAELAKRGTQVYHLNLASVGTEDDAYWVHTTRSIRCDLTHESPRAALGHIQQACDLVQEWWSQDDSILIVDEWAHLGGRANGYSVELEPLLAMIADKISAVSSTGIKRRRAIWTIAPEFVAGDLQQDAKAVKKLALMLLAIPKGKAVDWHGSTITFNEELYDQIARNYPITPFTQSRHLMGCDRCAFVDGLWMPLGTEGYALAPAPEPALATVGAPAPRPQRSTAPCPYPRLDGVMGQARAKGRPMVVDLLEWLSTQGQGATFTTQEVMNGAWAARWAPKKRGEAQPKGGLSDRSKATILFVLRKVEGWGLITARFSDDSSAASTQTWEVTLQ